MLAPRRPRPRWRRSRPSRRPCATATASGKAKAHASQQAHPAPAPTRTSSFSSLLSQIESEQQRIDAQKAANAAQKKDAQGAGAAQRGPKKAKKGKKGAHGHQYVPELEAAAQGQGEDRYAQMAVQAEKLQRDKVLAEARAAVAAASSQEGEGRRKKRKEKRQAEARERAEQAAIEKGLDPSLVLDDSVVEVPQGASVAKFAEVLGVSAERRHQAPVHAWPGAHAHPVDE